MDQPARDVEGEKPEQPEHQKDHEDRPDHGSSFRPGRDPARTPAVESTPDTRKQRPARTRAPTSTSDFGSVAANAVPGVAGRLPNVAPTLPGLALRLLPAALEVRFDVLEFAVAIFRTGRAFPAVPVSRLVVLVGAARAVVRARRVGLAPVRVFDRRVEPFGNGM